jgi:hypothetical protein
MDTYNPIQEQKREIKRLKLYRLFRHKSWLRMDVELELLSGAYAKTLDTDQRNKIYRTTHDNVAAMFKFEQRIFDSITFIVAIGMIMLIINFIRGRLINA